jgi:hypothetical protein
MHCIPSNCAKSKEYSAEFDLTLILRNTCCTIEDGQEWARKKAKNENQTRAQFKEIKQRKRLNKEKILIIFD